MGVYLFTIKNPKLLDEMFEIVEELEKADVYITKSEEGYDVYLNTNVGIDGAIQNIMHTLIHKMSEMAPEAVIRWYIDHYTFATKPRAVIFD